MNTLDSQGSPSRHIYGAFCRTNYDICQKVGEFTVPRVCETHDIDVYGRFANPLDWDVNRERQAM